MLDVGTGESVDEIRVVFFKQNGVIVLTLVLIKRYLKMDSRKRNNNDLNSYVYFFFGSKMQPVLVSKWVFIEKIFTY